MKNMQNTMRNLIGDMFKFIGMNKLLVILAPVFFLSLVFNFTDNEKVYCPTNSHSELCGNEKRNLLVNALKNKNELVNDGSGLFIYGPKIYLPKGKYKVDFSWYVKKVDQANPAITIHFFKKSIQEAETLFYDNPILKRKSAGRSVFFSTSGGAGHEFVVYINGSESIVDFSHLIVKPIKVSWYAGVVDYWPFFFSFVTVFLLYLYFKRKKNIIDPVWGGCVLVVTLSIVYVTLIMQDKYSLKEIALTGDSPNYIVYADYIHKYSTSKIKSAKKLYDSDRYIDLTNYEIVDVKGHVHNTDENYFFHHQVGYSWLIAQSFDLFGRGVKSALFVSALSMLLGVLFLYVMLLKYLEPNRAFVSSIMVGLSVPVILYSFSIYTEAIAFFLVTLVFYLIFFTNKRHLHIIAWLLGSLLLFLKFKYFAIIYPLFAAYTFVNFKKDKVFVFVLWLVAAAMLLVFLNHTYGHTGSYNPFSWYGSGMTKGLVDVYTQIFGALLLFLAFLFDQRFGLFLIVPFFFILIIYFKSYIKHIKQDRIIAIGGICALGFLSFYSLSASWGGESPYLRPHLPVFGILLFVLLSNSYVKWGHMLMALTITLGASLSMLVSSFFMSSYSTNYSHYYEMLAPSSLKVEQILPNLMNSDLYVELRFKRRRVEFTDPKAVTIDVYGNDVRLKTVTGIKSNGSIFSTGESGYVVYGPYIQVPRGKYKIELYGKISEGSGKVVFDISSLNGVLFSTKNLKSNNNMLYQSVIDFDKNESSVEFRLWVDGNVNIQFDRFKLTPIISNKFN